MVLFKNKKVTLVTIPKNTLLFRVVEDSDTDFKGVKVKGSYCVPPQYNVFFYFDPFTGGASKHWVNVKDIQVYKTTAPLKIVSLISPSKINRGSRMTKGKVIKSCNKTRKSCLKGRDYDPCFDEDFLEKNPSIVGSIGLGRSDTLKTNKEIENGVLSDVKEFIHTVKDMRGIEGPPELALYPFRKRYSEDVNDPDVNNEQYNYEKVESLPRNKEALKNFLAERAEHVTRKWYYRLKESS
jgi:hypothetical protein